MKYRTLIPILAFAVILVASPFVADAAVQVYKTQSKRDFLSKVYVDQRMYGNAGDNTAAHGRNIPSTTVSPTGMRICSLYDPTSYITQWSLGGFDSPGNNSMAAWNPTLGKWEKNSANYYHNSRYNYITCMTDAPPDTALTASKVNIMRGESVNLSWKSEYAQIRQGTCTATNFSLTPATTGSTGGGAYVQCNSADAGWNKFTGILDGGGSAGFGSCYVGGGNTSSSNTGSAQFGGSTSVSPQQTTTYTYTCTNANGSTSKSVTVNVASTLAGSCSASPDTIGTGGTVTWTATAVGGLTGISGAGTLGTWQFLETHITNYSCPLTDPTQAYSTIPNCPTSPTGKLCSTPNATCKVNTISGCNINTDILRCEGATSPTPTDQSGYTFVWSGSDGLTGNTRTVDKAYSTQGAKTASVTISADGESVDVDCDNNVTVETQPGFAENDPENPLPNLKAGPVGPQGFVIGAPMTLSALITNDGNKDTGAAFVNLFQIDNDSNHKTIFEEKTDTLPNLKQGASDVSEAVFTFPSQGTWYARACADTNTSQVGTITERTEADNCSPGGWKTISVGSISGDPSVLLTVDDDEIQEGQTTKLRWETENVLSCVGTNFSPGNLVQNILNGLSIAPKVTTDYTIDCTNGLGDHAYSGVKVTVVNAPTMTLTAAPDRVRPGENVRIAWNGGNSNSCSVIGPGMYETGVQGAIDVTIHNEGTYTLTCLKMGYTYQKSFTVRLLPGYGEE